VLNMPFGSLNYEAILALEPDLISAVYSGITQEEYDILAQIAPTIAQADDYVDFGMPWQETTILIGQAVGKSAEAEALVAEVEATRAQLREQFPQFQGATVAVAYNWGETYGFYTAQDGRGRFFTDLGFVVPDEHNELAGDQFYYALSEERVDLLDQDLLVFLALQFYEGGSDAVIEAINADPLLSQLDVVQDGRVFFVADEYDAALNFGTVLSLQYILENMVPEIAQFLPLECDAGMRGVVDAVGVTVCVPDAPEGLTVHKLVAQGRYPHQSWFQQWSSEDERIVNEALTTTNLTLFADRPVDTLSGGQRQRAWIAMALAQQTDILLLDEPTTFLDLAYQMDVLDLLQSLNTEGRTIVMGLHDLNHAARYADTIVALRGGQIVVQGTPDEIMTAENIFQVFGLRSTIVIDPVTETPMCVPIGRGGARRPKASASLNGRAHEPKERAST